MKHAFEFHHPESHLTVDILATLELAGGERNVVVVEVEGPSHYMRNVRQLVGSSVVRNKLLARLGYRVLAVPFYDWEKLGSDEAKEEYLTGLLR